MYISYINTVVLENVRKPLVACILHISPNFNPVFFCKSSTCKTDKRLPLSSEYPQLCPTLEHAGIGLANLTVLCGETNRWHTERLPNASTARAVEAQVRIT